MSRCWLEGELRAYLDRELPAAEMEAAGQHLRECRPCSAIAEELAQRAARVSALLAALEHAPAAAPRSAAASRRPAIAAVAALAAAACAAFFLWAPKRVTVDQADSSRRTVSRPAQQGSPAPARPARLPHKAKAQTQYYVALDDEPIESGVVVRVSFPDTGLLADVIYDEQGRPRAVRPLN